MLENMFRGLFDTQNTDTISAADFIILLIAALAVGLILAAMYIYKSRHTKGFVATIALLPAVVCVVIMMVNGNIGTGVAVMGAFNLVRFRSAPGSAKEICAIFLAMATGLIMGMGYIAYSFLCAILLGTASLLYDCVGLGKGKHSGLQRTLHITVPEDLNYIGAFDPLLEEYAKEWELVNVKTINMGSLFKLTYDLTLRHTDQEKEFIDKLRCRNGNLEIVISRQENAVMGL